MFIWNELFDPAPFVNTTEKINQSIPASVFRRGISLPNGLVLRCPIFPFVWILTTLFKYKPMVKRFSSFVDDVFSQHQEVLN